MRYDLVIFDLDGTLLDTLQDLAAAANAALRRAGFDPRTVDEVRRFIGNGVAALIRRAVPAGTSDEVCARVLEDFRREYLRNLNVRTAPFPGVTDMLKDLRAAGILTAVNSNKVDDAVQLLCKAHFPGLLNAALGEREDILKKPAPDGALWLMERLRVDQGRALYVGDGDSDLQTARNAGLDCAWVSWGYRRRDELGGLQTPLTFDAVPDLRNYIMS